MATTQKFEFFSIPGVALDTAKLFAIGSDKQTVIQTAIAPTTLAMQVDIDTDDTGRWIATYTDLPAGDWQLIAYLSGQAYLSLFFTTDGTDQTVQPWSEGGRVLDELDLVEGTSFDSGSHSLHAVATTLQGYTTQMAGLITQVNALEATVNNFLALLIAGGGPASMFPSIDVWVGSDMDGNVREKITFTVNWPVDLTAATAKRFVAQSVVDETLSDVFEITDVSIVNTDVDEYEITINDTPKESTGLLDIFTRYAWGFFVTIAGSEAQVAGGPLVAKNGAWDATMTDQWNY